jgi:hypothetical protein
MTARMRLMVCRVTCAAHWLSTDCWPVIGRRSSDVFVNRSGQNFRPGFSFTRTDHGPY